MRQGLGEDTVEQLIILSSLALHTGQEGIGRILGVSRRTISRWTSHRAPKLRPSQTEALARAVHPRDAALAERIAVAHGTTLAALGIGPPAPSPAAALLKQATSPLRMVDIVVCAAAKALDASPRAVRPALLAAFRTVQEMGLSVEDVQAALEPPAAKTPQARRTTR
jgi:hypothetical protein